MREPATLCCQLEQGMATGCFCIGRRRERPARTDQPSPCRRRTATWRGGTYGLGRRRRCTRASPPSPPPATTRCGGRLRGCAAARARNGQPAGRAPLQPLRAMRLRAMHLHPTLRCLPCNPRVRSGTTFIVKPWGTRGRCGRQAHRVRGRDGLGAGLGTVCLSAGRGEGGSCQVG